MTEIAQQSNIAEPQAFVADPYSNWDMTEISKAEVESLKSGDMDTWDAIESRFEPQAFDNANKDEGIGFLREIEPSRSNEEAWDQARKVWEQNGAIAPPYEKDLLCRIAKKSGVLQECIRAYMTIIEGFGHTFTPVLDPDADNAFEQVKDSIWLKSVVAGEEPEDSEPTDEEVNRRLEEIKLDIRFQTMRAKSFFKNAARIKGERVGMIQLRQRLRRDYEDTGEWYWEVLRDGNGDVRRLNYIPSISMRKMPIQREFVEVIVPEFIDEFTVVPQKEKRKFRSYLQVDPEMVGETFFKEFNDPRVLSSKTGKYYDSIESFEEEEPGIDEATEVMTDGIPDSESPYGVVRWIANSPAIGGSRKAEEVNFSYFDNKTIPPFIILVSGGRLSSQAQQRIKTYLRALKGSENFHKLLVLEAAPFTANMPGQPPQRVHIEVVPLIKFLKEDGLFLKYLSYNDTRLGANFACPPLIRGRSEEETRATARETLRFFEKLVAQPERIRFDELINTRIMTELGLTLVRFTSLGADTSDPEVAAKIIDILMKHGAMIPLDGRAEAEKLLHTELPKITGEWQKLPLKLSVAEVSTRNNASPGEELTETEIESPALSEEVT